jgi:uncharacterized membrane protein
METPASVARHPIHPMLITIPIGLWVFSFVCDLVVLFSDVGAVELLWFALAYYAMAAGVLGAIVAAFPGLFDFLSLRNRRLRKLGLAHIGINLFVVALYAVNLWLRSQDPPSFLAAMGLSALGIALLAVSGWLGGELVHVHGVGVASVPAPVDDLRAREPAQARHADSSATRLGST